MGNNFVVGGANGWCTRVVGSTRLTSIDLFKFFRSLENVIVMNNYIMFDIFEIGFLGQNDGIYFLGSSLVDFLETFSFEAFRHGFIKCCGQKFGFIRYEPERWPGERVILESKGKQWNMMLFLGRVVHYYYKAY